METKKNRAPTKAAQAKTSDETTRSDDDNEGYYNPELFAKEVNRRIAERRSKLGVEKLTHAEVDKIIKAVFKEGVPRPVFKEE